MKPEILVTRRDWNSKGTAYLPIVQGGQLEVCQHIVCGTGTLKDPKKIKIEVTNSGVTSWKGVLRFTRKFQSRGTKLFMPAFVYATNRGNTPQNVPNEFPRLRLGKFNRPSNEWWMVRSDRLSHPINIAVNDNHQLYGLCASPYYIIRKGRKVPWHPGQSGNFYQYSGFFAH